MLTYLATGMVAPEPQHVSSWYIEQAYGAAELGSLSGRRDGRITAKPHLLTKALRVVQVMLNQRICAPETAVKQMFHRIFIYLKNLHHNAYIT
jgi:hypothetical protein